MDLMDDVVLPCQWKAFTDYMIEEINQVANQGMKTVLKELCLVAFVIGFFAVVHHPNGLSNIFV